MNTPSEHSTTAIPGVGASTSALLSKVGLDTVEDVLLNIPRRYIDFSNITTVVAMRPGLVTLKVTFTNVRSRFSKRGLHLTEALANDETGSVKVVWFNQRFRAQTIKQNVEYYLSGEFGASIKSRDIINPSIEIASGFTKNTARMIPVYKLTKGLGLPTLRSVTADALKKFSLTELLPDSVIRSNSLLSRMDSLWQVHFPDTSEKLEEARRRLAYEELFCLILASELNRQDNAKGHNANKMPFVLTEAKKFVEKLPFTLTDDQKRVVWQIYQDLDSDRPMNRLVEGDVGSGKTVVAVMSALMALHHGFTVAIMAPTEILANQHYATVKELLSDVGYSEKLVLLTGSMPKSERKKAEEQLSSGQNCFVIGTHALIQDNIELPNLGFVIVDEQHRFGVDQRKTLQSKATHMPHVLHMTATPIPRSLALTLYGEIDISTIKTLPLHKQHIETASFIPEVRPKVYSLVEGELKKGHQAYVVCPKIEEGTLVTVSRKFSATHMYDELSKNYLKNWRVALIHGKMKSVEKQQIMQRFLNKEIDVLVSTTVIEVGVNVPNATAMVIEAADSFGLAQLHQLRGRVGRGSAKGYCYLVATENGEINKRLRIIENENDGYKLAELDLELRGPGAIYGTIQHGALDLRVAKLSDRVMIEKVRKDVIETVASVDLVQYKELFNRVSRLRTITNLN